MLSAVIAVPAPLTSASSSFACPNLPSFWINCAAYGGSAGTCCDGRYAEGLRSMCSHPQAEGAKCIASSNFTANDTAFSTVASASSTVSSCGSSTLQWSMDHMPTNDGRPIIFNSTGQLGQKPDTSSTYAATFDWDTNPEPGYPLPFEATFLCGKTDDGHDVLTLPMELGTFSVPTYAACPACLGGVQLSLAKLPTSLLPHTRWFKFHFEWDTPASNGNSACFDAHIEFTQWL